MIDIARACIAGASSLSRCSLDIANNDSAITTLWGHDSNTNIYEIMSKVGGDGISPDGAFG